MCTHSLKILIVNSLNSKKEFELLYNYIVKRAEHFVRINIHTSEVMKNGGYNTVNLAKTCVAMLFPEGNFLNAMKMDLDELNKLNEPEVISKVDSIIGTKVKQTVSMLHKDLGIDYGYRDINKALNRFIDINIEGFSEKLFLGAPYVFKVSERLLNKMEKHIPEELVKRILSSGNFKSFEVPEIIRYVFEFINSQDEYSKALEKTFIVKMIVWLQKERKFNFDSLESNTKAYIKDLTVINDGVVDFLLDGAHLYTTERNGFTLYHKCSLNSVIWQLPQIPYEYISVELDTFRIRSILSDIFKIVNKQEEYCKAVEHSLLSNIITKLYHESLL